MARKRLVVIDDDPRFRTLAETALSEDFDVTVAKDIDEGVEACEKGADLVLVDLYMPRAGGLAVAEALANRESTRHTPVLIVTSSYVDEQTKLALAALSNVRKTIDKLEGLRVLRAAVSDAIA